MSQHIWHLRTPLQLNILNEIEIINNPNLTHYSLPLNIAQRMHKLKFKPQL